MDADFRLAIIRNDQEICSIVPQIKEDKEHKQDIYKLNVCSSVSAFPIADLSSKVKEINDTCITFAKNDFLSISVKKNTDNDFSPFFKGIFLSKNLSYNKDSKETELKISAIHSFFKLSLIQYKDIRSYNNIYFSDFITEIANLVNIRPNEISMSDVMRKINIRLMSYNANIFRLFKDICLQNKLSVDFGMNNTVNIEYADEKTKRIFGQKPVATLTPDDILSMSNTEGII
jgi:hypothetical protein